MELLRSEVAVLSLRNEQQSKQDGRDMPDTLDEKNKKECLESELYTNNPVEEPCRFERTYIFYQAYQAYLVDLVFLAVYTMRCE